MWVSRSIYIYIYIYIKVGVKKERTKKRGKKGGAPSTTEFHTTHVFVTQKYRDLFTLSASSNIVENMENTNYMVKYRHKVGPLEKRGDFSQTQVLHTNNICPEFRPL